MSKTLELVSHYGKPSAVVLTFCPTQGREVSDTIDAVKQLGAQIVPVKIHHRVAYSRAQQTGLTAQELETDSKAAAELQRLWEYVSAALWTAEERAAA
jgi:chromosome partitioning protein